MGIENDKAIKVSKFDVSTVHKALVLALVALELRPEEVALDEDGNDPSRMTVAAFEALLAKQFNYPPECGDLALLYSLDDAYRALTGKSGMTDEALALLEKHKSIVSNEKNYRPELRAIVAALKDTTHEEDAAEKRHDEFIAATNDEYDMSVAD